MPSTEIRAASHIPVYPGEYEPLPRKKKELLRALKKMQAAEPPVNIIEMADHYEIELAAPGFRREDFFIYTRGAVLSIAALNKQHAEKNKKNFHLHGFNCECILRDIMLPVDADTDFYLAEYKNGVLSICFYKPGNTAHALQGPIIVY